jgi:hypothetical protein
MNGKSCFFIGHREASSEVLPALKAAIEQHITEYGVTEFIVGSYGGFDRLTAKALLEAKRLHPNITLSLLLSYHPFERSIEMPIGFDNTYYPPGMETIPKRYAIARANRYVIDHVDFLIAYVWHPASNARNLVEHAQKREQKGLITVTLLTPDVDIHA